MGETRSGGDTGGPALVEGRAGLRGLLQLYAESLVRLRGGRHLRCSLVFWTGLGLVLIEAFAVGVAQMDSRRSAVVAAGIAALWWLLISSVLVGGISLLRTPDGARIDYIGVPNGLTALRAWSCYPLLLCATLTLPGQVGLILWCSIGAPAGLLDMVDGYIARRVGPLTELGRALDPAGDALFFSMAALGNFALGIVPGWLGGLMLVRYVGPLVATPVVFLARRRPELVYTEWGRRNTLATGVVLFVCMWVRIFSGPVSLVALLVGAPLLGTTTILHFAALARRAYLAPVVREGRRERRAT
ncbi:MAG TPA: CDP-alcohol phosphatidyltransferase family protein [Candidatus Dormibacteraeota bacterium]|nr:CDP-alcohol phosphatidyltransferase family protein [Candidatus Dormibacteraeota bacterium]